MKSILLKYMSQLTTLSAEEQQAIVDEIQVESFKKGTILLRQGEVPVSCYFILKGCVRQYSVDEAGREATSNFYTEEQAIALFNQHKLDQSSEYTFACLEDCVLIVGRLDEEAAMYRKYSPLESMTRRMVEQSFGQVQEQFAAFIAASPEERFRGLLRSRPELIRRVPQHQLASYLGMTPESLSRIKKRVLPQTD
ncbi:Crp/Fnr family transcriptional regulator [Paenibacillus sp. GCM10023252]|uniref:Crp/Fnr family transcriptional regulator n=1 Tax=Paenibacillus sp. GCM10023252 TaxID=3252649 RepID=UPI00360C69E5